MASTGQPTRRFEILLIKPSHYDDDGYVIRWRRSTMPSNSLAVVNGLALGAAGRQVLGPDVAIEVQAIDETNKHVPIDAIIDRFRRNDRFGFVPWTSPGPYERPACRSCLVAFTSLVVSPCSPTCRRICAPRRPRASRSSQANARITSMR
jgi:hypothetical protein